MLSPKVLVFDLDGTLADTREDLSEAANRLRRGYGLTPLTVEEVISRVGGGAPLLVRRLLGEALAEGGLEAALTTFLGHYEAVWNRRTQLYPAVTETLRELAQRFPLAILSNKTEGFSRKVLAHLGIEGFFREVIGGDTLASKKPDPAGLVELARRFAVEVTDLLLIGDSRWDAETAFAAGCPFVFCAWGFAGVEEAGAIERDPRVPAVLEEMGELVALLAL